jgi:acyl-CoA thioesterase-1
MMCLLGNCEGMSERGPSMTREQTGTIVALGNSLTAGYGVKEKESYPVRLEKKLREAGWNWRVINAGISGETSGETRARIDAVLNLEPAIVILEIGINDGFRGTDPQVTRKNIDETVRILKAHKVMVILAGMRMFTNQESEFDKTFAAIYPAVAEEHGLILIPFFLAGVAGEPSLTKADGVHPAAKGYRIVTETVYPYLLQALESKN